MTLSKIYPFDILQNFIRSIGSKEGAEWCIGVEVDVFGGEEDVEKVLFRDGDVFVFEVSEFV